MQTLTLPIDNEYCKTNDCIKSWLTYRAVLSFFQISLLCRGLHGLKTEARTRPVPEIVWPNPTRPDPSGTVKFRARTRPEIPPPPPQRIANKKKRKKAAFHDCMQRNRLIKALPFHKHLPVMKVCEHQVHGRIHSAEFMNFVWTRR